MALKTEVMSLRLPREVMEALGAAARRERRTKANMAEVAIIEYAKKLGVYREPEERIPANAGKKRRAG